MTVVVSLMRNWASLTSNEIYVSSVIAAAMPDLRVVAALIILWSMSGITKLRLMTAYLSGINVAFYTWVYLGPMFHGAAILPMEGSSSSGGGSGNVVGHTRREVEGTQVALVLMSFFALCVGCALGSLLPRPFSGLNAGLGLTLLVTCFVPALEEWFVVAGPGIGLICAIFTGR